jgi:hypothetical protein
VLLVLEDTGGQVHHLFELGRGPGALEVHTGSAAKSAEADCRLLLRDDADWRMEGSRVVWVPVSTRLPMLMLTGQGPISRKMRFDR